VVAPWMETGRSVPRAGRGKDRAVCAPVIGFHRRAAIILLLSFSCVRADSQLDLKSALARLGGREAVKARVDYQIARTEGAAEKQAGEEGRATVAVEDGSAGMRIFWSKAVIQAVNDEHVAQDRDPDKRAPIQRAMDELSATRLNGYLNAAPELLRKLEGAQLLEETAGAWEGQPARILTFKLTPHLNERSRKYVKEIEITARLWIGADGVPMAAENRTRLRGRALLVISFESSETEEFRFREAGDRLVVLQHVREASGSGGGENSHEKTTANLTLADS